MNDLILFAKAFSEPTRVRIIAALRHTELCVCELVDALELGQSTLSMHLQVIRQAGLVTTRKQGKWIYYGIESDQLPLIDTLFAHHQTALDADRRLKRDAERIQYRCQLREDDCCVVASAALHNFVSGGDKT